MDPPGFKDSRQFAWASEAHALGFDPLKENPVNPRGHQLNYPRIWHLLFALGINESHTNLLGTIVVILFFIGVGVFWYSKRYNGFVYIILSIAILSPAVMLGIERSNIELILFFVLTLALASIEYSTVLSLSLFLFASVLKIYPVFGFVYLLKERKRKFWILFLSAASLFLLYALFSLNDFLLVYKTTPKLSGSSFGINVWWMGLRSSRFFGLPISDDLAFVLRIFSTVTAFVILAVTLYKSVQREGSPMSDVPYIDEFRVGAAIYIGCFLLMNTHDYRLIFLVFTVPQVVSWMRSADRDISIVSRLTLPVMIFSLWSSFIMHFLGRRITFVMEESCNWVLFAGLLYLFFSSLPAWLRNYVGRPFSKIKLSNNI